MAAEKAVCGVAVMSRVLGVSRSGYYAWRRRPESRWAQENAALVVEIRKAYAVGRGVYGSPRVRRELEDRGIRVGRHRVARLMRENGIRAKAPKRFRVTTKSDHEHAVAENVLERRFWAKEPDQAWVSDISYVWTKEGWLYLAVILDLCSRMVVGWSMRPSLGTELALGALQMALTRRNPKAGLVHHSDRGVQYASRSYRRMLQDTGLVCSMSRKGNVWDNAVAESFFGTMKRERVHGERFETRSAAQSAIYEYIEVFYNRKRRHSTLGYVSPLEYEKLVQGGLNAAA
jgi:putative transposase